MEIVSYIIPLLFIFWLGTRILKSLSRGKSVKTVPSSIPAISGVFTLILYGNDLETVAILGKEGERYTFEPFAPEFKYAVKKGGSGKRSDCRSRNVYQQTQFVPSVENQRYC